MKKCLKILLYGAVTLAGFSPAFLLEAAPGSTPAAVYSEVETAAVDSKKDAADDPAIWVHPQNPAKSILIATNKAGGLLVYDLNGRELHSYKAGRPNNVDVRYNFPLNGHNVDIIGASERGANSIILYKVDPVTRGLTEVQARNIVSSIPEVYGFCLYHSLRSDKFYAFVVGKGGDLEQWELFDNSAGKIDAKLVRSITLESQCEGLVADDEFGKLYVGEEDVGIWQYGAEPADGSGRIQVDSVRAGRLVADVEGLALYYGPNGKGYLLASSQGNNSYAIYERGQEHKYLGSFQIADGAIDGTSDTDGIDVIGFGLGPAFPYGLFVAQDGLNMDDGNKRNQNFKIVAWQKIADALQPRLMLEANVDPRRLQRR